MLIELCPDEVEHLEPVLRDRVTAQIDVSLAACEEGDPDHAACHLFDAQLTQALERAVRAAREDEGAAHDAPWQAPPAPVATTPTPPLGGPTVPWDHERLGIRVYGRQASDEGLGATPVKP